MLIIYASASKDKELDYLLHQTLRVGESLSDNINLILAPVICLAISIKYFELNPISKFSPL